MKALKFALALVMILAFSASIAQAKDHVPYFVLVKNEVWVESKVWAVNEDGSYKKNAAGEYFTVSKWSMTQPRRVHVVVVKKLFTRDSLWPDTVYAVPDAFLYLWDGKVSGEAIKLPTGWEGWKKLSGGEKGKIRDEAKSNGRYFASPTKAGAVVVIETINITGK